MRERGWLNDAGELLWPPDTEGRQRMARELFGMELVSRTDSWILTAEDELDGAPEAAEANPETKMHPKAIRRQILQTLKPEQREAVRELLRYVIKGQMFSFCVSLDQTLKTTGGSTISIEDPGYANGERIEFHSPNHGELHTEQHRWLKDFSIVFGKAAQSKTET